MGKKENTENQISQNVELFFEGTMKLDAEKWKTILSNINPADI